MIDQFLQQTSVMQLTLTFEEKKQVRAGDVASVVENRLTAARTAMQRGKWHGRFMDLCFVISGVSVLWSEMSPTAALLLLLFPQLTSLITNGYENRVCENVTRDEMVLTIWKAMTSESSEPGEIK